MGALNSVYPGIETGAEDEETNVSGSNSEGTPRQVNRRDKRILSIDPRSPSGNIMRTPIVVDRTPSHPQSRTTKAEPTSATKGDPRSPTADFTRTPLCFGNAQRQSTSSSSVTHFDLSAFESPLSVLSHHSLDAETPLSHHSLDAESGIESAEVTPILRKAVGDSKSLSSPDSAVNSEATYAVVSDCSLNVSSECSETVCVDDQPGPVEVDPLLVNNLQGVHISQKCFPETTPLVQIENTPQNHLRQRQLVLGKKIDSVTMNPKILRSPLSLVDNSPRYGRMQKSTNRQLPSDRHEHADKENILRLE